MERVVKAKHKWLRAVDIRDLPTLKAEVGCIQVILPAMILADVVRGLMKQIIPLSKDGLLPGPEHDVARDLLNGWEHESELLGTDSRRFTQDTFDAKLVDEIEIETAVRCKACGWNTTLDMFWGHHSPNFCKLYKGAKDAGNWDPDVRKISKTLGTQPGPKPCLILVTILSVCVSGWRCPEVAAKV